MAIAPATAVPQDDPKKAEAKEAYEKVVRAYLTSDWGELAKAQKEAARRTAHMTPSQRGDLLYVRKTAPEYRPAWWRACKSTVKTNIRARIWGRMVQACYVPAESPGVSTQINGQRVIVQVSWNPSMVESPTPEKGQLAEDHGLTKGDIGEVVVWRQMGFSYFCASVPGGSLLRLFRQNQLLYQHLAWFVANLTSMSHCSPKARRAAMLVHGSTLQSTGTAEAYTRACRAISSLFVATVLADPSKWPSVNLPYVAPETEIEKNTGVYLYMRVDPSWTLAEDKAWRETLRSFFKANGDRAWRGRGKLVLPNKMVFMLMEPDDREHQKKRDAWVKQQLEKASK